MGARQDRQADDVDVLLEGRGRDHLRRLAEARVDDLEALVAQAAGEDLRAAVVAVEAGLGDQDLDRAVGHGRIVPCAIAPRPACAAGTRRMIRRWRRCRRGWPASSSSGRRPIAGDLNGSAEDRRGLRGDPGRGDPGRAWTRDHDWILLYAANRLTLEAGAPGRSALASPGTLWIAYPKGTSKTQTDLTRDAGWDRPRRTSVADPRRDRRALVGFSLRHTRRGAPDFR